MALNMDLVPPRIHISRRQMFKTEHALSLAEAKLRLRQANHSALLEAIGDLYLIRRTGHTIDNFDHALSCFRKAYSLYSKDSYSHIRVYVKIGCTWYIRLRSLKYLSNSNTIPIHLNQSVKALEYAIEQFEKRPPPPDDIINSRAYTLAHYCRTLLYEELYYYTLNSHTNSNKQSQQQSQDLPNTRVQSVSNVESLQNSTPPNSDSVKDDNIENIENDMKKELDAKKNEKLSEILGKCIESSEKTMELSKQLVTQEKQLNLPMYKEDEYQEHESISNNLIIKMDEEKLLEVREITDEEEIALFVATPYSGGLKDIEKARCMICYASAVGFSSVRKAKQISKGLEYLTDADRLLANEAIYIEQSNNLKFELDRQMETLAEANKSSISSCVIC